MNLSTQEEDKVYEAFSALMGMNGNQFAGEIISTGVLSQRSYELVCDNISYNGQRSIEKYFGLVHFYYLQSKRVKS